MMVKNILFVDYCNFIDYQTGGHLTFARNLMYALGDQLSLIGITTDKTDPLGKWFKKEIDGTEYNYFALMRYRKSRTKHFIPDRIVCALMLRYYRKKIIEMHFENVFIQRPEILPVLKDFGYINTCYCFPGTENPMNTSKYSGSKFLATAFDKYFFNSLKNVQLILASADDQAIQAMVDRSNGTIKRDSVFKFPTRINDEIFKSTDRSSARERLKIPSDNKVVVTVGRLSWLKGWKFMIDSFILFEKNIPGSVFFFVGDGEDLNKIIEYIKINRIENKIFLVGRKTPSEIALYLNASDLFIMGSYKEGWSTSLIEAVACGIPACVSDFSAASEIVMEGVNGYIERKRNAEDFASLMVKALNLEIKEIEVSQYSITKMKTDLLNLWHLS
jgi:glycosyltransferase involved in cell wall biosynthesis